LQEHLSLDVNARQLLQSGKAAILLPAFEFVKQKDGLDSSTFPKNKASAIRLVRNKKLAMFHDFFKRGHNATEYQRWYKADSIYKVTKYQHSYEPYVILKNKGTPWCDERFVGYGANKAVSWHFKVTGKRSVDSPLIILTRSFSHSLNL
jgi:glycosyltransferase-like protein LARGE